jgi:hypothetical protein
LRPCHVNFSHDSASRQIDDSRLARWDILGSLTPHSANRQAKITEYIQHTRCTSISGLLVAAVNLHAAASTTPQTASCPPLRPRPCKVPPCKKATVSPPLLSLRSYGVHDFFSLFTRWLIDSLFLDYHDNLGLNHSLPTVSRPSCGYSQLTATRLPPRVSFQSSWAGVSMDNGHEFRSRRDDNGHGSSNRQLLSPPKRLSSPLLSSPTRSRPTKEKRNPSVTPRRFRKFFTPTAASMRGRRILSSLDETSTNRQPLSPSSLRSDILSSDPVCPSPSHLACENAQKRKFSHDEEGSSDPKDDAPLPPLRLACGNEGPGLLPAFRSSQGAEFRLQTTEQDRLGDWRKATLVSAWSVMHMRAWNILTCLPGPILPS